MIEFGRRWDFSPAVKILSVEELAVANFSYVSLRLETFIKYGGPLAHFLRESESKTKLRFYSDYLPAASARSWESVHQLAAKDFFMKHKVLSLTCRNVLPEVPPPAQVAKDLLENLSKVEIQFSVSNRDQLQKLQSLERVGLSLPLKHWMGDLSSLAKVANRVNELEIELNELSPAGEIAKRAVEFVTMRTTPDLLAVTFLWPHAEEKQNYFGAQVLNVQAELRGFA